MQLLAEYMDGQFVKLTESLSPIIDKVAIMQRRFVGFDDMKLKLTTIESAVKATNQELRSIDITLSNLAHRVDSIEKQQFTNRDSFIQVQASIKRAQQQLKAHVTHA